MTRDEELAQLVAEQEADDTNVVQPDHGQVDIDPLANFLSQDEDGNVVCHLRPEKGTVLRPPITGSEQWHGTRSGYTNHGCRCVPCRGANAEYMRERRRDRS
jgi:hypothetical protein